MAAKHHILSADVTPQAAALVRAIARSSRTSVSAVVRHAIAEYLARRQ